MIQILPSLLYVLLLCRSTKLPQAEVYSSITAWFPRLHSLVIGPGLGRDPRTLSIVKSLIFAAKAQEKDIIIDAVMLIVDRVLWLNGICICLCTGRLVFDHK